MCLIFKLRCGAVQCANKKHDIASDTHRDLNNAAVSTAYADDILQCWMQTLTTQEDEFSDYNTEEKCF